MSSLPVIGTASSAGQASIIARRTLCRLSAARTSATVKYGSGSPAHTNALRTKPDHS
jgi:hypothetical protein